MNKKTLFSLLLLSLITIGIFMFLFSFLSYDILNILSIIFVSLIGVFFITNIVVNIYMKKLLSRKNLTDFMTDFLKKTDSLEYQYESSMKKLNKVYKLGISLVLGLMLLFILAFASIFWLTINDDDPTGFIAFLLLMVFSLGGMIIVFSRKERIKSFGIITRSKYKELYKIVDEVQSDLHTSYSITIYLLNMSGISIGKRNTTYTLQIGIYDILTLSREELKSVIYHEIGHAIYENSSSYFKRHKFIERIQSLSGNNTFSLSILFLFGFLKYLNHQFQMHHIVVSKHIEEQSDSVVLKHGYGKAFISALTKSYYFNRYLIGLNAKATIITTPELNKDYYEEIFKEFKEDLKKNKELYDQNINDELESPRNSHPPLRIRMKYFNITDINIQPFTTYHDEEASKAIQFMIDELNKVDKHFLENAYSQYKIKLNNIKTYEENPSKDINQMLVYAISLYETGDTDKAFNTYKEIIEINDNIPEAQYYYGYILLTKHHDIKGVEHIYKAIELVPTQIQLTEHITYFAIRTGNKELLESNRQYSLNKLQTNLNEKRDMIHVILPKTKIKPLDLNLNLKDKLKEIAKEHNFYEVFAVEKKLNKQVTSKLILVKGDNESTNFNYAMDKIYRILELENDLYGLNTVYNAAIYKKLYKVTKPFYRRAKEKTQKF